MMKVFVFLPFLLIYALLLCGTLVYLKRTRLALLLLGSMVAGLYLMCTPLMTRGLMSVLGSYPPVLLPEQLGKDGAKVVVVAGGGDYAGQETGLERVAGGNSLQRLRYAARLSRQSGLPILLTGIEAKAMERTLVEDYGIKAEWVEHTSRTTAQNAERTAKLLMPLDVTRIVLVTDAWHMGRAVFIFQRQGFDVIPAPTSFPMGYLRFKPSQMAPRSELFTQNMFGLSELLGQALYRFKFSSSPVPSPAPSAIPVS